MRIQHNITALNAHRNLTNNNSSVAKNLEKLSSGYRINRAGDDAAGLAISEKMRAQITGLETAQKNAEDGVSLVQTAEGALTEVHSMLNRMVELATQSANGTYSQTNRQEMQKEIDALEAEIDRISNTANFNGTKFFKGGVPNVDGLEDVEALVPGSAYTGTSTAILGSATEMALTDGQEFTLRVNYSDADGSQGSVDITLRFDKATKSLVGKDGQSYGTVASSDFKATAAEIEKSLVAAINDNDVLKDKFSVTGSGSGLTFTANEDGAGSWVNMTFITPDGKKTDVAMATSTAGEDEHMSYDLKKLAKDTVFTIGGQKFAFVTDAADGLKLGKDVNVVTITGTNADVGEVTKMAELISQKTGYTPQETAGTPDGKLHFRGESDVVVDLHVGESSADDNKISVKIKAMSSMSLGINSVDITTTAGAKAAIDTFNAAIDDVSSIRSDLGAMQNRLEHTINNLGVQTENITAAESRIRDVDMAKEMMAYTKNNILVQASQAMLAQANQVPQGVLQLLQ